MSREIHVYTTPCIYSVYTYIQIRIYNLFIDGSSLALAALPAIRQCRNMNHACGFGIDEADGQTGPVQPCKQGRVQRVRRLAQTNDRHTQLIPWKGDRLAGQARPRSLNSAPAHIRGGVVLPYGAGELMRSYLGRLRRPCRGQNRAARRRPV